MEVPSISSEPITASSASLSLGGSLTSFTLRLLLLFLYRSFSFLLFCPGLLFLFLFFFGLFLLLFGLFLGFFRFLLCFDRFFRALLIGHDGNFNDSGNI